MRYIVTILAICLLVVSSYADTPEEMLAIMKGMDDAYRAKDIDQVVSYYAEDAIIDSPPFEPWGKEDDREFLKGFMKDTPFSLANPHYLASDSENVGVVEHSTIYTVNGSPIDGTHICAHDFEEGKMKRLTVYLDYAIEPVQSGMMTPRNLGDMIPSFPLPMSEPTELAPMDASAELLARLNSYDLSNVAKMIREDADIWYSLIGRPANRSMFIDIHEQFIGGFSDLHWENVRRVDMRDGWVFSEVKLVGTNDSEFLGKPATGLPMEVRAGLIEHYDENGIATYIHLHFDTLSIPGQGMPTDEGKDEILAIMKSMDDAYRIPDADLVVSHYAEDAIIDCPPFGQWGKEEDRKFVKDLIAAYPTFSITNAHYLASGSEGVGIAEHSSVWIFPDTGIPYDGYHICAHDFDNGKMTRLNCYIDYAAEQIQSGAMPQRNLGDMIPSFALPAPEATGLDPMKASEELIKRLNSHDLSGVAKMIRTGVDFWYSFIGRTANRSELIDIHEQFIGGFSDMSWENVRRVDMGDGWLFSEVKLIGTNDGEFLGKPATGLPMEVRSGLIEHYDEDGLATYVHFHFDTLSVPGQEAPEGPVDDFTNVFFTKLNPGLNMISVPLKPATPYTARSFAEVTGSTLVIKYDENMRRFVGFDPKAPGDGFDIEGGKGYIVNVPGGETVSFTGAAWTNEPSADMAPPTMQNNAWAFMVSGLLSDGDAMRVVDGGYAVTVKNIRTGETFSEAVDTNGYFTTAWADLGRSAVIRSGDKLEIAVMDSIGNMVSGPFMHEIKLDNIRDALVNIPMKLGNIVPKSSLLLQNYPNPFNPETWIPFQLSKEADVSIRIFNASGKLVRTLSFGRREPGLYIGRDKAIHWDGKNEAGEEITSGIYFYTITAGEFSATRKMIVKR